MLFFEFDKVFKKEDYLFSYSPIITPKISQQQTEFIIKALSLKKNDKVLDLCCGFGRISNLLAEQELQVVGLDSSDEFLNMAREEAKKKELTVNYLHGDMRALPFNHEFDAIINIFTSFGYFLDEENLKVLQEISKSLKPKGKFLIDVINKDWVLRNYLPYVVSSREGGYIIEINDYDSFTSTMQSERLLINRGRLKKAKFFVRMYTYTELNYLLKKVGLKIISAYGSFDLGDKFSLNSKRMILISQKDK